MEGRQHKGCEEVNIICNAENSANSTFTKKNAFMVSEKWAFPELACVRPFVTPRTRACQAPLSMGFSSKNTGVSCHFFLPGDILDPGMEPASPVAPALQVGSLLLSQQSIPLPELN